MYCQEKFPEDTGASLSPLNHDTQPASLMGWELLEMEKEQPAAKDRAPSAHWWLIPIFRIIIISNNNFQYHQFFMVKLKHSVYPV